MVLFKANIMITQKNILVAAIEPYRQRFGNIIFPPPDFVHLLNEPDPLYLLIDQLEYEIHKRDRLRR